MDGGWGFQKVDLGCGGWSLQIVFQSGLYKAFCGKAFFWTVGKHQNVLSLIEGVFKNI